MTAAYFEDQPTDPDKVVLRKPMHPQLKEMLEDYFDKCFAESASKRTWVGLTKEEVFAISNSMPYADRFEFAEAIEAKLKEKNERTI